MLNLNQEFTFGKEKQFINYCLGCFRYAYEHGDFSGLKAYYSGEFGMSVFEIDYKDEAARRDLVKKIVKRIKADESAYMVFRIDFDFNMLPGEKETAEDDWILVRTIFDAYCREMGVSGFLFTHFAQDSGERDDTVLTKHVHIVYQEPFTGPTFSEYLHKHLT